MNVGCARIPVSTGVFAGLVSLLSTRTDQRLVRQEMAHATGFGIFAARTIVSTRGLDRLPARKRFEQLTDERRLADIGSETANTNYDWKAHKTFRKSFTQRSKVKTQ